MLQSFDRFLVYRHRHIPIKEVFTYLNDLGMPWYVSILFIFKRCSAAVMLHGVQSFWDGMEDTVQLLCIK